jgi:aminopeptidase-like protein
MTAAGSLHAGVSEATVVGVEMMELARRLFPLRRSLTGDGVRETFRILQDWSPLDVVEVPSGTAVFDWVVPSEWNVRAAWIADTSGRRIVDLEESSLHVVGYSVPVRELMRGADLRGHLHWLPEHPEWIPARTSYYDHAWGFCVTGAQLEEIEDDGVYEVLIDASLDESGSLTLAEAVVRGRSEEEILLSTYVCHPSLANDNLSGIVVQAALARLLRDRQTRFTYRLLFAPSTIGALAWLQRNEDRLSRLRGGLVISCVGDPGPLTYKRSRRGDAEIDRAAVHVVERRSGGTVRPFVPWGGDERQFCSPGFDLPVGSLTRTPHARYPEYHTSADDLALVTAEALTDSLSAIAEIVDVLEGNVSLERIEPRGEPQLGRRGLYENLGAGLPSDVAESRRALLWALNLADGRHTLLDAAEQASLPFGLLRSAADLLFDAGLVLELE